MTRVNLGPSFMLLGQDISKGEAGHGGWAASGDPHHSAAHVQLQGCMVPAMGRWAPSCTGRWTLASCLPPPTASVWLPFLLPLQMRLVSTVL